MIFSWCCYKLSNNLPFNYFQVSRSGLSLETTSATIRPTLTTVDSLASFASSSDSSSKFEIEVTNKLAVDNLPK